ncbi:MAG TPA: nitrilase-related carbon-nitrogen hydrolase, partial [Candidatus Xenobia bacterium]
MRIAIIQLDTVWEQKVANYNRVNQLLDSLSDPVDLICLPEMFATGFTMQADDIAEAPDGPTFQFLEHLAQAHGAAVAGTTVERGQRGGRNTCLLFDKTGTLVSRYAKMHPFSFAGEDRHYEKGDHMPVVPLLGFQVATP